MVFITGDTHGRRDFNKLKDFAKNNSYLTKEDYMIIAGDFGGVWNKETLQEDLEPYQDLPFTVLFVDGNHENFDLLESYPVEEWNGGHVHRVAPDVIHLMRGQIYSICGKSFFAFGGGTSTDKHLRNEGTSWWERELPTYEEYDTAVDNLNRYDNKVDYIITHSCDKKALFYPPLNSLDSEKTRMYRDNHILANFEDTVEYGHWYFGHYHLDGDITDRKTVVYRDIIRLI